MNPQNNSITCIVPFYNEGKRVFNVLEAMQKIDKIDQIICVDDGSLDDTYKLISNEFKNITVLRLDKNSGKANAVLQALKKARGEYVMLIDSDLVGIKIDEITQALSKITSDSSIDMILLKRANDPWFAKLTRVNTVFVDRILRKSDLLNVFENYKPSKYQLEIAINLYMMRNKKQVRYFPSSGSSVLKMQKIGFVKGFAKETGMFESIFAYAGIFNTLKMLAFFGKKSA